jgi:hypothetical protein
VDVKQLRTLLDRPEIAGAGGDRIADYYVLSLFEKLGADIQTKGLKDTDITAITSYVKQYEDTLSRVFPEKASQLNEFISGINAKTGDLKAQQEILERASALAKEQRQKVLKSALKPFFQKEGMETTSDTYTAFKSVFSGEKPVDKVRDLRKFMDSLDPADKEIAESGLRTAYNRYFRQTVYTRTPETGGGFALSGAKIFSSNEEFDQFFALTDEVFADLPEVSESLRELTVLAANMQSMRSAKPNASWSPTAYKQDAMEQGNRMINVLIGPLNRKATRARTALATAIEARQPDREAANLMNKILSDPEYFADLSRRFNKEPDNPALRDEAMRWFASAEAKSTEPDPEVPPEDEGEVSRMLREARGTVGSLARKAGDAIDEEMNQIDGFMNEVTR